MANVSTIGSIIAYNYQGSESYYLTYNQSNSTLEWKEKLGNTSTWIINCESNATPYISQNCPDLSLSSQATQQCYLWCTIENANISGIYLASDNLDPTTVITTNTASCPTNNQPYVNCYDPSTCGGHKVSNSCWDIQFLPGSPDGALNIYSQSNNNYLAYQDGSSVPVLFINTGPIVDTPNYTVLFYIDYNN